MPVGGKKRKKEKFATGCACEMGLKSWVGEGNVDVVRSYWMEHEKGIVE